MLGASLKIPDTTVWQQGTPGQTVEIEFITSEDQLFFTADDQQLIVEES